MCSVTELLVACWKPDEAKHAATDQRHRINPEWLEAAPGAYHHQMLKRPMHIVVHFAGLGDSNPFVIGCC